MVMGCGLLVVGYWDCPVTRATQWLAGAVGLWVGIRQGRWLTPLGTGSGIWLIRWLVGVGLWLAEVLLQASVLKQRCYGSGAIAFIHLQLGDRLETEVGEALKLEGSKLVILAETHLQHILSDGRLGETLRLGRVDFRNRTGKNLDDSLSGSRAVFLYI